MQDFPMTGTAIEHQKSPFLCVCVSVLIIWPHIVGELQIIVPGSRHKNDPN